MAVDLPSSFRWSDDAYASYSCVGVQITRNYITLPVLDVFVIARRENRWELTTTRIWMIKAPTLTSVWMVATHVN